MLRLKRNTHHCTCIKMVDSMPLKLLITSPYRAPTKMGYKELAANLNAIQLLSSRGKLWTFRALYRMMQRQQVALYRLERELCQ